MTDIIEQTSQQQRISTMLSDTMNRILWCRGVRRAEELDYGLAQLPPDSELKGMTTAVAILQEAIFNQEHIMIVGDFDCDGATSTALAVSVLKAFGAEQVSFLVPNRFDYGYGLTPEIVALAAQQKPDVLVTVDNGISSVAGVAAARALGIKVVVTDHHLPGQVLPNADAIVNPNQHGDHFPSKCLAGVGVIFYVMLALRRALNDANWFQDQQIEMPNMGSYLDLVALGTVADVVPLDHVNRVFVDQGMRRIRAGKVRPGIQALLEVAKKDCQRLTTRDLGFAVGPRLNAAGRLDDMSHGIQCLLCDDMTQARVMADELDALNKARREIEEGMKQQAFEILKQLKLADQLPLGVCLYEASWHQGVVGLVASRVKDQIFRPVIAFADESDTHIKGSARSVPGVHIRDVLDEVATTHPAILQKFGGHAMAAGLSLAKKDLPAFQKAFATAVQKHLSEADCKKVVYSDGPLLQQDFNLAFAKQLLFYPWGQGFIAPQFCNEFSILEQRIVGSNHLKLKLQLSGVHHEIDAIWFGVDLNRWPNYDLEQAKIIYQLDVNLYMEIERLQLLVVDIMT